MSQRRTAYAAIIVNFEALEISLEVWHRAYIAELIKSSNPPGVPARFTHDLGLGLDVVRENR